MAGLAHHVFRSKALGQDVGLVVATPADYQTRSADRYPVIYMVPGIGGDEWAYLLSVGREGPAWKALFADPATAPIVVFGNPGSSGGYGVSERMLSEELVAFVDRTYRTRPATQGRSLEGFSLGGLTALTLFLRHPDIFGRVAAGSSACYLLSTCDTLRADLVARAQPALGSRVLLWIGSLEPENNTAVNDEMARLFGVELVRLPDVEHDWGGQLRAQVDGREFGQRVAAFHLAGFRP